MRIDPAHLRERKRKKTSILERKILEALLKTGIKPVAPFNAIERSTGVFDIVIGKERFPIEVEMSLCEIVNAKPGHGDPDVKWFATVFYPKNKKARAAEYEHGVLARLCGHDGSEIILFTPWGPRYDWEKRGIDIKAEDKEIETLNFLAALLAKWREKMPSKKFHWVFLGADLYGTRINNLPEDAVAGYFASLAKWLGQILPEAEFRLWSEFDKEVENSRKNIWENFGDFVDANLLLRAEKTAQVMARGSDPKAYLVERITEAMFIEQTYRPIKISCVPKYKDDKVDWVLPRLYLIPTNLQAPWL